MPLTDPRALTERQIVALEGLARAEQMYPAERALGYRLRRAFTIGGFAGPMALLVDLELVSRSRSSDRGPYFYKLTERGKSALRQIKEASTRRETG